jgi:hypothetical protein
MRLSARTGLVAVAVGGGPRYPRTRRRAGSGLHRCGTRRARVGRDTSRSTPWCRGRGVPRRAGRRGGGRVPSGRRAGIVGDHVGSSPVGGACGENCLPGVPCPLPARSDVDGLARVVQNQRPFLAEITSLVTAVGRRREESPEPGRPRASTSARCVSDRIHLTAVAEAGGRHIRCCCLGHRLRLRRLAR